MKICFLIPSFSDGGAQRQCIMLANHLSESDNVRVSLIHFHDGVHAENLNRERIQVIKMPVVSNYDPRNIFRLISSIREIGPDIVFTWLHSADVYGYFIKLALPGVRWVMTERNSYYPSDLRFILRRKLGRFADLIVANSEQGADYWRRTRRTAAIAVIGNIVPRSDRSTPPYSNRVVTIGRLEPQKNPENVVRAFVKLAERHREMTFAVIGEGSMRARLESVVEASDVSDRISFLGFRKDVLSQIEDARLVVSMSHHEGLPNVLIESADSGRLVIASDIPEHRELLGENYPYLVADRMNPEKIANAIERGFDDADYMSHLQHANAIIKNSSPEHISERYLTLFDKVLY